MIDSQNPTNIQMVLQCRVHDIMVAGSISGIVKVSAHLNGLLETNIVGKLIQFYWSYLSPGLGEGDLAYTAKLMRREVGSEVWNQGKT